MEPKVIEEAAATTALPEGTARNTSRLHLARRIIRQVRAHPANLNAPNRALLRACGWQMRKRLTRGSKQRRAYDLDLIFPAGSGSLSNLVYFGECFEWENINFIRRYLRPGDSVVDVGGNVGMFTYAVTQATAPDGRVHVFEPLPWAAAVIAENAQRNHLEERVIVHQIAASDSARTVRFASDLDVSSHMEFIAGESFSKISVDVATGTLDAVLPDGPLALVKLDVEGAEALALAGFRQHLEASNPPVVIVEAHQGTLRKMGSSRSEVLAMLRDWGYEPYLFNVSASRLMQVPPNSNQDIVAVHNAWLAMVNDRLVQGDIIDHLL